MENWMWWAAGAVVLYLAFFRGGVPGDAHLSPGELRDLLASQKDLQLVDVRTAGEFSSGHLAAARNIPLDQLQGRLGELDKSKPLAVYCRSGHRSSQAIKILRSAGFAQSKHMDGGIMAWQGAGMPVK